MPRDSPTVGKGTIRIFLAISSINNWKIKTTDIKSALETKTWTLWIKRWSKTILPECEGRITEARLQNV